jgi:Xaa-Pro aminopeptidase
MPKLQISSGVRLLVLEWLRGTRISFNSRFTLCCLRVQFISFFLLEKTGCPRGYRATLFHRGSDATKEKWDGPRTPLSMSPSLFSLDASFPISSLSSHLRSLLPLYSHVYADPPLPQPTRPSANPKSMWKFWSSCLPSEHDSVLHMVSASKRKPLAPEVGRLRSIKSTAEQEVMAMAADISARAHSKVHHLMHILTSTMLRPLLLRSRLCNLLHHA